MSLLEWNADEQSVFSPDPHVISRLMMDTWRQPCWEYTPEVLRGYIEKPTGDPQMSMGIFVGGEPAGYLCHVPYRITYQQTPLEILYGTWWTASPKYPGRNIALKLQRTMLHKAREKGAAALFTITHHASYADKANNRTFGRLGESFQLKETFSQFTASPYRIRRRLPTHSLVPALPYEASDKEIIGRLMQRCAERLDLCQMVGREDMDYVFRDRPGTRTWVYRKHDTAAFLNVVKKRFLGERVTTNAYVEKASADLLSPEQRLDFFSMVLADPFWKEIDFVSVPDSGLFESQFLQSLGFVRSREQFNLYCIPFTDQLRDIEVNSFCLDIF